MVTVERDPARVESRLRAGEIGCPRCADGVLRGWGHARIRQIAGTRRRVRPRRARCGSCASTHVLLPVSFLLRRAYSASTMFSALLFKTRGEGHRRIAARLDIPATTVRGWLRRFADRLDSVRVWFLAIAFTAGVDVTVPSASGSVWIDTIAAIAVATEAITTRFGAAGMLGTVTEVGVVVAGSGGRLLAPRWPNNPAGRGATRTDPAAGARSPSSSRR